MTSPVDICNLALSFLGDSATVASIDPPEASAQARLCAVFYPQALSATLQRHPWSFATVHKVLTKTYHDEATDGWAYVYEVPSDCVFLQSVKGRQTHAMFYHWSTGDEPMTQDYRLALGENGRRVLLTNIENPEVAYTTSNVSENNFPSSFTMAVAWRLAALMAGARVGGDQGIKLQDAYTKRAEYYLTTAKNLDSLERQGGHSFIPLWIARR